MESDELRELAEAVVEMEQANLHVQALLVMELLALLTRKGLLTGGDCQQYLADVGAHAQRLLREGDQSFFGAAGEAARVDDMIRIFGTRLRYHLHQRQ